MAERTSVEVDRRVLADLHRVQAELEAQTGRRPALGQVVGRLVDERPRPAAVARPEPGGAR